MHDYIGYKLNDKVLIGYYVYLEESYSYIYTNKGILYVLTKDEKYLREMFNHSVRYAVYSDMKTRALDEDFMNFKTISEYKKENGLQPQKEYTREDIKNFLIKLRLLGNTQEIYSYETFKDYILNLIETNSYQELIDEKEYILNKVWQGKLLYPAIERKGSKYRYVGASASKYYDRQAPTLREELIRLLEVL